MTSPAVTVIIPTHDHAGPLEYSIASVLHQTVDDLALVVIGDGVGDDTRAVVAEAMRRDSRVSFVDRPKTPRHGEPLRHEVICSVDSPAIGYQGDDDLWLPNHLEVMLPLLAEADFAHPLPILVGRNGLSHLPIDLAQQACIDWHGGGNPRNAVSLTGVVHTRSSYLRLPSGWEETPIRWFTDHYMWSRYFALDGFRARTSPMATTIKLAAHGRDSMSPEARTAEIAEWWERVLDADFAERWHADVERCVRQTAVSLHMQKSAAADELAKLGRDFDLLEGELAAARQTNATDEALLDILRRQCALLQDQLDAIHNSTSWRITKPLRTLGHARKRRSGR